MTRRAVRQLWLLAGAWFLGVLANVELHERATQVARTGREVGLLLPGVLQIALLATPFLALGALRRSSPVSTWTSGRLCAMWGWLACATLALGHTSALGAAAGLAGHALWGSLYAALWYNFHEMLLQLVVLPVLGMGAAGRWFGSRPLRRWGAGGVMALVLGCLCVAFAWTAADLHTHLGDVGLETSRWVVLYAFRRAIPPLTLAAAFAGTLAWVGAVWRHRAAPL